MKKDKILKPLWKSKCLNIFKMLSSPNPPRRASVLLRLYPAGAARRGSCCDLSPFLLSSESRWDNATFTNFSYFPHKEDGFHCTVLSPFCVALIGNFIPISGLTNQRLHYTVSMEKAAATMFLNDSVDSWAWTILISLISGNLSKSCNITLCCLK